MSLLKRAKAALLTDVFSYSVILVAACIQLRLISQPLDFLLSNVIPDDAFYYFEIARNTTLGNGVSVDGVEPTNGFHPLWFVILLPVFSFFTASDLAPIQAALGISVLCNIATGYILLRILRTVTNNGYVRAMALALWSLNPFLLFETINGLETALSLLFLSLFILVALRVGQQGSYMSHALLGGIAGLMILARIDTAFYLAVFLAWLLISNTRNIRKVLITGCIATALVMPWFIWSYVQFGMLLTNASEATTLTTKTLIVQDNGDTLLQWGKAYLYNIDYQVRLLMLHTGAPALILMLIGAAGVLLTQRQLVLPSRIRDAHVLQVLFVGFLLLFFVNVVIRFFGRSWYFVSIGIFISLLVAVVVPRILPHIRYPRTTAAVVVSFMLFAFSVSWSKHLHETYSAAREMYAAALWSNENVKEGEIVGAFNSGIQSYFTDARVVNLDGLVNDSAFVAMKEKRLYAYMRETQITYLIDFDIYLDYRYRAFLGTDTIREHLIPVATIARGTHSRSADGIHIYRFTDEH